LEDVASRLGGAFLQHVGLFHDLGKGTVYFQDHLYDRPMGNPMLSRHSLLGAELFLRYVIRAVDAGTCSIEDAALGYAMIKRHHGGLDNLVDGFSITEDRGLISIQWASFDWAGLTQWLQARKAEIGADAQPNHAQLRVKTMLALKGQTSPESAMARFQQALVAFGSLIEADRDSAARFSAGAFAVTDRQFSSSHVQNLRSQLNTSAVDAGLKCERDRLLQAAGAAAVGCPPLFGRLWSLTAPTGSGKTLAALDWAFRRRKARAEAGGTHGTIVYALPFTSIIDQTVSVLADMYGVRLDESVLAVHHHQAEPGALSLGGEGTVAQIWTEGWRADVVCTTFVQVVNALFHGTPWDSRRLKNVAGNILILDEVQAIPTHLWKPFAHALKSLADTFGTDVLLMTATQPALFEGNTVMEIAPADYSTSPVFNRYDVSIDLNTRLNSDDLARNVEVAIQEEEIDSCLVVLNTIDEALNLFQMLADRSVISGYNLYHLSTNLRPKDRRTVLDALSCVSCRRAIVISTQVVEAGVDLSFDVIFRALAPVDSIIQAAGRCNRHGTGRRGLVRVFELTGETAVKIYGNVHIDVARSTFGGAPRILTEPELRSLVHRYYLTLSERTSRQRAALILEAVKMMEFANLRGEAARDIDREKRVQLIEEDTGRVPHYIEMDDSDTEIWFRFRNSLDKQNWSAVRKLRNAVAQRIVEVPGRLAHRVDAATGLAHIGRDLAPTVYSTVMGWRRQ
jgi:CRISPR-associated endonuclease/helicase Cas3